MRPPDTSADTITPLPADLAAALPGTFIVFDGPDGSGKSTQLERFAAACRASGIDPVHVREPGGTLLGERLRDLLLAHTDEPIDVHAEMLLYMASRAQLVRQRIAPALAEGRFVLADRFVSSTLAYQGTAGGLDPDHIRAVAQIACGNSMPDLTVIFDVDEQTANSRLSPLLDRMEAKGAAFHKRVRVGYLDQIKQDPDHYARIDATRDVDAVTSDLVRTLQERLA
ncbi:MAG: dTMP kinase [Planctomycetota bacterium]